MTGPMSVQTFGVLLVGMLLGSKGCFAALLLYLAEGAIGLPVFNPIGPGGLARLMGATGGFLLAYPLVAGFTGFIMERGQKSFARAAAAGFLGEVVLFTGGLTWLGGLTTSVSQRLRSVRYWVVCAEVI